MDDNNATVRIRDPWAGTALTAVRATDLRDLYSELQDTTTAAAILLGTAGALLTGTALRYFRELDADILEITERIRVALG